MTLAVLTNCGSNEFGTDADPGFSLSLPLRAVLLLVIAAGLTLRLAYPGTTVFCEDQAQACALAEDIVTGHWQTGGLSNSGGFRNLPGFAYILAAVWRCWPDPYALLGFTAGVNVLAVICSGLLMRRWIGAVAAWWGTAFLAAAPWAIHYSRWIWAQHLLFPVALLVYFFLYQWLSRGRRWAATATVLALALLVQIHLIGVVLTIAIILLLIWCRTKPPWIPLLVGAAIAIASLSPYLLDGHLSWPDGNRLGYQHSWRVIPGAAMSLTGVGWQLAFRDGYPGFADVLGWRRWPYEAVMTLPILLFAIGLLLGLHKLWRERRCGTDARRSPLSMAVALVVFIPLSFALLGLRTSPTYLPIWYPLPFVLMGWLAAWLRTGAGRYGFRWVPPLLVAILIVGLAFFVEQLHHIQTYGGVPGAQAGRRYAGMGADVRDLASRVDASEVWLVYEGPSVIQDEPAAFLFRRAKWGGTKPGRAVIHFEWWRESYEDPRLVVQLPDDAEPPDGAYLVRPWYGPWQLNSEIPLQGMWSTTR